jgi:hypothetical protein
MSTTIQTQNISRLSRPPTAALVLWILIFAAVPISISFSPAAWDVAVYRNAIRSLRADHDPYLDAIATQKLYYSHPVHPVGDPPFSYVYSPITLPILRFIGILPIWLSGSLYWLVYSLGVLAEIWVAMLAVEERERRHFLYLGPLAVFFSGLLFWAEISRTSYTDLFSSPPYSDGGETSGSGFTLPYSSPPVSKLRS